MTTEIKFLSPSSHFPNPNYFFGENNQTKWTPEENKQFETALALFDKDTPDRWYSVAAMIPGKTVSDVIKQYRELEEDVSYIESGLIPLPGYYDSDNSDVFALKWMNDQHLYGFKNFYGGPKKRSTRPEKNKGVPWTKEEHRQFLLGLKKYGKGDWRNISRNFVTTRTATQVASHAQKYFIRQLSGVKDKRRSSIHDITTIHLTTSKSPPPSSPPHDCPPTVNIHQQSEQQHYLICGQIMGAIDFPISSNGHYHYGLKLHDQNVHRGSTLNRESFF
ncbi:hypothetical protein LguiA_032108 [Lonicera macranthoides]